MLNTAELAQIRSNVFGLRLGFAKRAWKNTQALANNQLGYQPSPTDPNSDVSDWRERIYLPGLRDGNVAYVEAAAYVLGGNPDHARRSREICLAWARTYRPPPARYLVGHMVAEPVGPVIKMCMAYLLARSSYSMTERRDFESWAAYFVDRGVANADFARDQPWLPDADFGGDVTNPASYSNSATWQRAMAVYAAAVVGGRALKDTLEWNFAHRTARGRDYGWNNVLEGVVLDGTGGEVVDGRVRRSLHYGLYSWIPLVLIADLSRRARFRVDLFRFRSQPHGYTVFTPVSFYGKFLLQSSVPSSLEGFINAQDWPESAARWRAAFETLYRNAATPADVKTLARIVNFGGSAVRGDNFDIYMSHYGALFGRGPKGPAPVPTKNPKRSAKTKTG